jgi:hypothetical protein
MNFLARGGSDHLRLCDCSWRAAVKVGLMQSLYTVFLISLGILLAGLFLVVFLPEIELQPTQPDTKE